MKKILAIAAALSALVAADALAASQLSTTFTVSATVIKTCNISVAPLVFGNYDVLDAAPKTAQADVTLFCSKGSKPKVSLNGGSNASFPRQMNSSGADKLTYDLFTDNTYVTVWGDGTNGSIVTAPSNSTGSGNAITLTIFGKIPELQDKTQDAYSDTVTASVTF
jgi:spore coat protein U-like protein